MRTFKIWAIICTFIVGFTISTLIYATSTSEIYISCTVASFGGYTLKGTVHPIIAKPGENKIGHIEVNGGCNEPYPWILRIYTDNKNYQGLAGSLYPEKIPSGLIREGGGSLPIKFQTDNTGPEWVYIPDINNPNYKSYFEIRNMEPGTGIAEDTPIDVVVAGLDPRNPVWVAGNDGILYTDDDNIYGDRTLITPFKINLAVQVPEKSTDGKTAPHGKYGTKIILEIISEP